MSPQPTAAPAQTVTHPKGSPAWLVQQARELEKERGNLMERIGANRAILRNMHKADALEADLKEFVEKFYPEKEKGVTRSADEIEATRKEREKARKG